MFLRPIELPEITARVSSLLLFSRPAAFELASRPLYHWGGEALTVQLVADCLLYPLVPLSSLQGSPKAVRVCPTRRRAQGPSPSPPQVARPLAVAWPALASVLTSARSSPLPPRAGLVTASQLAGEYGLRNKREIWRIQLTLSKIRRAARELLKLDAKDPKRLFEVRTRNRLVYRRVGRTEVGRGEGTRGDREERGGTSFCELIAKVRPLAEADISPSLSCGL